MKLLENKLFSVAVITIIYIVAFIVSLLAFMYLPINNLILKFLVCDIIGTIIVFIGSLICKNSSIYDPYWSILPMVLAPFIAHNTSWFHLFTILIIVAIELWGLRLTINWFVRFKNLREQDWRYTHFQMKHPKLWPLINLFGIHLVPTLVVFVGMLPVFAYMDAFSRVDLNTINITTIFALIVSILAIVLEMIADIQMNKFRKNISNKGKINESGLWKISRHPNYFGEILFWFSMFLFALSVRSDMWVLVFCPLIVFLLFAFVSIPLLEKRQLANKKEYAEYKKRTNMLLPFFAPYNEKKDSNTK